MPPVRTNFSWWEDQIPKDSERKIQFTCRVGVQKIMNDPSVSFGHFQIVPGQVASCIARSETTSSTRLSAKKNMWAWGLGFSCAISKHLGQSENRWNPHWYPLFASCIALKSCFSGVLTRLRGEPDGKVRNQSSLATLLPVLRFRSESTQGDGKLRCLCLLWFEKQS